MLWHKQAAMGMWGIRSYKGQTNTACVGCKVWIDVFQASGLPDPRVLMISKVRLDIFQTSGLKVPRVFAHGKR